MDCDLTKMENKKFLCIQKYKLYIYILEKKKHTSSKLMGKEKSLNVLDNLMNRCNWDGFVWIKDHAFFCTLPLGT